MLASTQNLLQMCSFDATKSTKGASKLRRDLINTEIANLRDLLPLPSSTRQRLSQLQLMALVCVYVRKANYFHHAFRKHELIPQMPMTNFGFSKALNGFLMMMTQNGKLLYISDNAAEYLGHSMEDLLIHGDSVYDIIEKQDHQTIQSELMRSANPLGVPTDSRIFLCRMNVSRNSRRQMRFGDQKVVLIQGHFVSYLPLCSRNEPVFLATCTPVAMPETRECVVQGSTNVFTSIHSMDMKFIHLDGNGEFHLGYNKSKIKNLSWYDIVHWDYLKEAQSKHRLITQSEQERSCILLLRLQTSSFNWIWVHVVLQVKDNNENSQQPVIVCTNQVLSDKEAAVMQANSWLYQFYSLHSKMHYTMQNPASPSSNANSSCTGTSSTSASNSSSYEPSSAASSQARSPFSASYSSGFGGNHSLHHSVPVAASEAPSLALHPTHPNMAYYSHNGVSVSSSHYHAGGHFGSHHSMQQYSPQAGSLPYQAVSSQTSSSTPSTPPASSQTEHRVKEEPSPTTASTRPTKRNRASSQQEEEKRHPKKKATVNTTTQADQTASANGTSSSAASTYSNYHASSYGAYHPTGSVFSASSFGSELSMMPAYYGGSMSAYHHHPAAHHSQLTYSSHFQGKFPFFEHGTAGSTLTGGQVEHTHTSSRQTGTHRSRTTEEGSVLSSAFTTAVPGAHIVKPNKLYPSEINDRRELDKVRSPESSTSDYGSMSSQSPPSTFDKSFGTSSLSNSGVTGSDVDYHNHYSKSNWPGYSSASHSHPTPGDKEGTTANSFHLSRLSSFQFWPGYTSVTPEDPHSTSHRHPHLASTFPVDPLQTYGQNLFSSYPHHVTSHEHYNADPKSLVSRVALKTDSKPSSPVQPSATKPTSPVGIAVTRAL